MATRLQGLGLAGVGLAVALRAGVTLAPAAPGEAQPDVTVARSTASVTQSAGRSGDGRRARCPARGREMTPRPLRTDLTAVPMLHTAGLRLHEPRP